MTRTHRFGITAAQEAARIGMGKAFYTVDEDEQTVFHRGKNRIKVTEHFAEKGKPMSELLEELILYAARQEDGSRSEPAE